MTNTGKLTNQQLTTVPVASNVAVVVITYNAERTLDQCIRSILSQSHPPAEIIAVDAGSTDGTLAILRSFPTLTILTSTPGFAAQRNLGAKRATSDYLLFIDSDMVLPGNLISEALEHANYGADALVIPETFSSYGLWGAVRSYERQFYDGVEWMESARWFRRSVFETLGGYDERCCLGEEWDLDERARQSFCVQRTTSPIWCNEGRVSLLKLLNKKAYYADISDGFSVFKRKHPIRASLVLNPRERLKLFINNRQLVYRHLFLFSAMAFLGSAEYLVSRIGPLRHVFAANPWIRNPVDDQQGANP